MSAAPSVDPQRAGPLRPAAALREVVGQGYTAAAFRADLAAGIVVGVIALPLSMALAIATGVPPQHGLYTAIVGGAVIALLGGSRVQVSGPTAAFIVILAPIVHNYGVGGLLCATLLAGAILIAMSIARMGRLIEFIPYPVTTGFTSGIAVVIATLQIKDFLGLQVDGLPEHYLEKIVVLGQMLPTLRWPEVAVGASTLAILLIWPRISKRIPAPIVALTLAGVLALALAKFNADWQVATINSRFTYTLGDQTGHGIPPLPPRPAFPWSFGGPDGQPLTLSFDLARALVASALAIAMLGAIESLLSAVVADGMARTKHDPDAELFAQGVGNVVAPFFGGFAATGAIARTATNIRAGARSPIAATVHALFVLAAVLALAPLLGYLPMAALAAQLLMVARNMAEVKHFVHILRVAPRSDAYVMLLCFALTIFFDMVIAVGVGVVLASLLFMRRMADVSGARLATETHPAQAALPRNVLLYEIAGPLFFGAAQKAMTSLHTIAEHVRAVVLDMRSVPTMDATGMVALESALERLHESHVFVVLAGVRDQPLHLMAKAGWKHREWLVIYRDFEHAMALLQTLSESDIAHHALAK